MGYGYLVHMRDHMLPLLALLLFGSWIGRRGWIPLSLASTVCLYVFSPAQIISGLTGSHPALRTGVHMFLSCCVQISVLFLLAELIARAGWVDPDQHHAFLMTVLFTNTGYMGLPVCYLAYGERGLAAGVLVMVSQSMLSNSLGVYLAARGRAAPGEAALSMLRSPVFWSLLASIGVASTGAREPAWLFHGFDVLGRVSIPAVLMLLGAQLSMPQGGHAPPGTVVLAVVLRLLVAPLCAAAVARITGEQGLLRTAFVLQAAMPCAMNMSLYAIHFDCHPRLVSTTVFWSTAASLVTIAAVLALQP